MMFKMMSVRDNCGGDDDVCEVDKNWAASGDINGNDSFDVDEGDVVVDAGSYSGEDFDARVADDIDDYYGD